MQRFNFTKAASIAIDLGNSNTILGSKTNALASQPSYIVFNSPDKTVRAVGQEAYDMAGKTNHNLKVIKPLKGGVIKDYDSASQMLKAMVRHSYPGRVFFSRFDYVVSGVPYSSTEVERRALRDTLAQFSASKTYLLFEPIAAAIGMGIDIHCPDGVFIVDIGGGITETAVISLSGIVNFSSIRTAGDAFDNDIQEYIRKKYQIDVSLTVAEKVKINVGAATQFLEIEPEPFYAVGKDSVLGIPKGVYIGYKEIVEVLNSSIQKIEQIILQTLEECPPELAGDIYGNGIYLTGGGSLLKGLKERLKNRIGIPVHSDPNALLSVTRGIQAVIANPKKYQAILLK